MAKRIALTHTNGLHKEAFIGFSWTSLFFGFIPAIFRGDFLGVVVYLFLAFLLITFTAGLGLLPFWILWAIFYNKWHTRRLVERGYQITGGEIDVDRAKSVVNG